MLWASSPSLIQAYVPIAPWLLRHRPLRKRKEAETMPDKKKKRDNSHDITHKHKHEKT